MHHGVIFPPITVRRPISKPGRELAAGAGVPCRMAGRMGVTGRLTLVTVSLVGLLAAQSPTPALGEDCTITDPHGWQKGIDGYWTEIYTKWYDMNKSFVMASLAWEAEDAIYDEMHSTEEILGNKEPCPNNGTTHDIKKCESYNEVCVRASTALHANHSLLLYTLNLSSRKNKHALSLS